MLHCPPALSLNGQAPQPPPSPPPPLRPLPSSSPAPPPTPTPTHTHTHTGHPDFVYQSCTHQRQPAGSMEGHFAFVEGSLQAPGREFNAACAPLSLDVPQVIF